MDKLSREIFDLWHEMTLGSNAELTIPSLIDIQTAWRSEDSFESAMIAARDEANRLGEGLWEKLARAGLDAVFLTDQRDISTFHNSTRTAQRLRTMREKHEKQARLGLIENQSTQVSRTWGLGCTYKLIGIEKPENE